MEAISSFFAERPYVIPNIAWILIIIILAIFFKINFGKKKSDSEEQEQEAPQQQAQDLKSKTKADPETAKPKRKWNFSLFGWTKKLTWDKVLVWIIVPCYVIIRGLHWYYYGDSLSFKEIFFGVAVIVFATRSNWFRWAAIWGLVIVVLYHIGVFTLSLNLSGTPSAVKVVPVYDNKRLQYDVSIPRWTAYYIFVPDNSILEIIPDDTSKYHWDSTDRRGPVGPEGIVGFPTCEVASSPLNFLASLRNEPFAGLIGKVGEDGIPFFIGKHYKGEVKKGGFLYIGINYRWSRANGDWRLSWKFAKGTIMLEVIILPAPVKKLS